MSVTTDVSFAWRRRWPRRQRSCSRCRQRPPALRPSSTSSVLRVARRAGLEHHAHAFEDAGYTTARHIYGLDADAVKGNCGVGRRSARPRGAGERG